MAQKGIPAGRTKTKEVEKEKVGSRTDSAKEAKAPRARVRTALNRQNAIGGTSDGSVKMMEVYQR